MKGRSIIGYAIVSGLCLLISNVVLIAGDWAKLPLSISIGFSYLFVVIIGYVLHSAVSFSRPLALAGFGRYALAMSVNIPLAFGAVWLWRDAIALPMVWAAPLATLCSTGVNFVLSRWAVLGGLETLIKPWSSR
jgi:putative flippase GtrA